MPNLTPYLLFEGNCAEAMKFYKSCLGGELSMQKVNETPMKNHMRPDQQDKVINARLISGTIDFSASDWLFPNDSRLPKPGNLICMYINSGSYADTRDIFDKLSADAPKNLMDDLRDMPFGSYGALTDKYGVRWMFQSESKVAATDKNSLFDKQS